MKQIKLYYFTNSYPFGLGEDWKTNELITLQKEFDDILIIPYHYGGNKIPTPNLPIGINYTLPLFEKENFKSSKLEFYKLFNKDFIYFLTEFFKSKVFLSKNRLSSWFHNSIRIQIIKNHPQLKKIINASSEDDVFYFFWGKGACEITPFTKIKGEIFIRMHGYDLYKERNNGYIPYRQQLLDTASKIILISQNGINYLKNNYLTKSEKLILNRIGVHQYGISYPSKDKILRVFSCSSVIPLKRVGLIAKALVKLDFPIFWTHIGDGPEMDLVKTIADSKPSTLSVNFTGMVPPREVNSFYADVPADLFINVSTTEGVPVSIMEAIAAGIPIMATNVGGTSEIVNTTLGVLVNKDITVEQLGEKIKQFYLLDKAQLKNYREGSLKMYSKEYQATNNINELVSILKS